MTIEAVGLLSSLRTRKAWAIPKVQGKTHIYHRAICHSKTLPWRVSHHCERRRESHPTPRDKFSNMRSFNAPKEEHDSLVPQSEHYT